ncbi:MAG: YaiI/YqxD family protein [bacterium]|nr:YaiI/YqxD family protein [bacterium]
MRILVDADASPVAVKEILFRAAERVGVEVTLVTNLEMRIPDSVYVSKVTVGQNPDEADDRIVEICEAEDLVITADIPLAARVVEKGAQAIDPRGTLYSDANVRDRLATRDLMDNLRSTGMISGGPPPFNKKDAQAFANALDRFLAGRRD